MSEVINAPVNAPSAPSTSAPTTEVVGSGDSTPVTFDDLTDLRAIKPKGEKKDVKVEAKDKGEKPEGKETKEAGKEKADTLAKAEQEKAKEKEAVAARKLKAKLKDKEMELDEDIMFSHKVDGQSVDIPIKELLSNYSGKTAWDKRFSELDRERKSWTSQKTEAEARIKSIMDAQDPEERFFKMAEFAGKHPVEVRRKFLEENMNLLEKWYGMSEDERKADELQFENKYLRTQAERAKSDLETRTRQETLAKQASQISQKYGIDIESYQEREQILQDLRKEGKLDKDVSPDFVASTLIKDKLWDFAESQLKTFNVQMPEAQKNEALMSLVEMSYDQGLSQKQLADVVDELWGSKAAKTVVEEKIQQRQEFMEGKKAKQSSEPKSYDVWSFDQM